MLPWLFVLVFCIVAPALVFYTAGYRWNVKKGKVERNGTIILDSTPRGASVLIDGRSTEYKTPVTIRRMVPGQYRFTIFKSGYHTWEKRLDIRPERVTFTDTVTLWKQQSPLFHASSTGLRISFAPDERTGVELLHASGTAIRVQDLSRASSHIITLSRIALDIRAILWAPSGRYMLLEVASLAQAPWLVDTRAQHAPLELPRAQYRWSPASELIGTDGLRQLRILPEEMNVTHVPFTNGKVDVADGMELRHATGVGNLVLMTPRQPERGLILPAGNWTFWSHTQDTVLFRDGENWLAVQNVSTEPTYHRATGDVLRPSPSADTPRYLLIRGNELWLWDPITEPLLLYRHSDRLIAGAWHREGKNVFFATESSLFAIHLNTSDDRLFTHLASFDRIRDMAVLKNNLIILATQKNQTGTWELKVE